MKKFLTKFKQSYCLYLTLWCLSTKKNGNLNVHNSGKCTEKKIQKISDTPIKLFKINCEISLLISILINRDKINDCFEIIFNSKFSINLYFNNSLYRRLIWT